MKTPDKIKKLLEKPGEVGPPPEGLHWRIQDDHDGTFEGAICVGAGPDGDMYIGTDQHPPIRFRNYFGGGMSLRTHQALVLLAHAIALDNEEKPQQRCTKSPGSGEPSTPSP